MQQPPFCGSSGSVSSQDESFSYASMCAPDQTRVAVSYQRPSGPEVFATSGQGPIALLRHESVLEQPLRPILDALRISPKCSGPAVAGADIAPGHHSGAGSLCPRQTLASKDHRCSGRFIRTTHMKKGTKPC
jgi:hypothetical protein